MDKVSEAVNRETRLLWSMFFALNLPLPLFLGFNFTENGARYGMIPAIILLWLIGHLLCGKSQIPASELAVGGGLVAATQIVPILQIFAGMVGLLLAMGLEGNGGRSWDESLPMAETLLGGFVATWVTGGILIGITLFIGRVAHTFLSWVRRETPSAGSRMYDRELDG